MGRARFIIYPWFFFFSLFSLRPDPDRHSAILKVGVNHATCYVYSPKAVETLLHEQCYGYVKYIFFSVLFVFIRFGFEENNKYAKKVLSQP